LTYKEIKRKTFSIFDKGRLTSKIYSYLFTSHFLKHPSLSSNSSVVFVLFHNKIPHRWCNS